MPVPSMPWPAWVMVTSEPPPPEAAVIGFACMVSGILTSVAPQEPPLALLPGTEAHTEQLRWEDLRQLSGARR